MSKRIYQYPEVTELQEGDVMLIDKEGNETAKSILASKVAPALMSKTITERGTYKASDDGVRGYNEVDVEIPYTDIHVATGPIATFEGEDLPLKSLTASIVPVQAGSGDPSPSNIRPISGWSSVGVTDCAVNIWDEEWEVGDIDAQGNPTSSTTLIRTKNFNPCKPSTTYKVVTPSNTSMYMKYYDKDKNFIAPTVAAGSTITTPSNCYYFKFVIGSAYGTTYNNDISINYPSTDTEYHAYSGTTTTIPFVDGQGQSVEVFGGECDVVNGVVTPCPYYASYNGEQLTGEWISDRDVYAEGTTPTIGAQVVNIGATGTPFSVQPTSIKSLDGENNLWASTGDVDVEYQTVWVRPTE
jgi:hypothetical protein